MTARVPLGAGVQGVRVDGGDPVLLLHGLAGLDLELKLVSCLADRGFEILAPEHPGFGDADYRRDVDSADSLSYVYLRLVDQVAGGALPIVGTSFGAWVAAEMATKCPHACTALLLLSPLGIRFGPPDNSLLPDIFSLSPDEVRRRLQERGPSDPTNADDLSDEHWLRVMRSKEAVARYCWSPYMHTPHLFERLDRITAPTVLVRGENDRLVSRTYIEAYAAKIPTSRIEELPDVGHHIPAERPEGVADRLVELASATGALRARAGGS